MTSMCYAPTRQTSSAITIMRPLLILFMTLAHLFMLNSAGVMNAVAPLNMDNWLTVFLKSTLAKSGVPLLSLFSGYLAVYSLEKYGYLKLLLRKARRLVWPLFWANLLFIILITYPTQAVDPNERPDLAIYPFNFLGWFQATFAFYRLPANQPLFFLKDLFTCFLVVPVLLAVARIKYVNMLVILWMAYKCIYLKAVFIFPIYPTWFFRFDIIFAFYIGILLFLNQKDLIIRNKYINLGLVCLFLMICGVASVAYVVYAQPEHTTLFLWMDFTVKAFSVLGCIALMSLLSKKESGISRLLTRLSPYAYTLFLTHVFSFTFFDRLYLHLFPRPEFFGLSGSLYIPSILVTAVLAAILLRMIWSRAIGAAGYKP